MRISGITLMALTITASCFGQAIDYTTMNLSGAIALEERLKSFTDEYCTEYREVTFLSNNKTPQTEYLQKVAIPEKEIARRISVVKSSDSAVLKLDGKILKASDVAIVFPECKEPYGNNNTESYLLYPGRYIEFPGYIPNGQKGEAIIDKLETLSSPIFQKAVNSCTDKLMNETALQLENYVNQQNATLVSTKRERSTYYSEYKAHHAREVVRYTAVVRQANGKTSNLIFSAVMNNLSKMEYIQASDAFGENIPVLKRETKILVDITTPKVGGWIAYGTGHPVNEGVFFNSTTGQPVLKVDITEFDCKKEILVNSGK